MYVGSVLWILSPSLREEVLRLRPLVTHSSRETGLVARMLARAERLEISSLVPITVSSDG